MNTVSLFSEDEENVFFVPCFIFWEVLAEEFRLNQAKQLFHENILVSIRDLRQVKHCATCQVSPTFIVKRLQQCNALLI